MVPPGSLFWAAFFSLLVACQAPTPSELDAPPALASQAAQGKCPRQPALDLELPTWDLYVAGESWDALHADVDADVTVAALLCVKGRAYPIDLELQGASSRALRKKSFDLKFAKARPLEEAAFGEAEPLRRILLKAMAYDQTLIREALAFELWRALGYVAPRVGFANLRVNGAYWGLYNLTEPINDDFLARHGFPEGGNLYKAVRTKQGRADFKPGRDLHTCFEDKSDQADDGWPDLSALADKLGRTALRYDAFMTEIDSVFPLAPYIDRMIWVALTQNSDAIAQNFYLYDAPVDGRPAWTMFPWDSNVAFGAHWSGPYDVLAPDELPLVSDGSLFGKRLLQVAGLRARYVARFRALLAGEFAPEPLLARAARLFELVRHDLASDQRRWQREVDPDEAYAVLEAFLNERGDALAEEVDALE